MNTYLYFQPDRWSVLDLATCGGDSNSFLLASVSDKYSGRCSVVAYSWQELLIRKNAKICWSVDQSCISQMPVDINQICVDRNDAQNTGTVGKFFIAGGGPPVGQAGEAANAIKVTYYLRVGLGQNLIMFKTQQIGLNRKT